MAVTLDQTVVMPMQLQGQGDKFGLNLNQNTASYSIGSATFKAAHFEVDVAAGNTFVFNGLTNVGQPNAAWWCSGANMVSLVIGAFWNADADNANSTYVPATIVPAPNGQGGCNLTVIAAPAATSAVDQDGDGYAANAADQSLKDSDDADPLAHPNQLESWGDNVDFDCNGKADPASWKYTAKGGAIVGKVSVQVVDANSWSNQINDFAVTYPMTWNAAISAFEVSVGSWKAPTNYVVRYKLSAGDVVWQWTPWNQGGACQSDGVTFQVSESEYGTIVPFTMTLADQCHLHKQ